jgi:hypothetical protein
VITLTFVDHDDPARLVAGLLNSLDVVGQLQGEEESAEWQTLADALGEVIDVLPDDLPAPDPDAPRVVLDDRPTDDVSALLAAVEQIKEPQIRAAAQALAEVYGPWKHRQEVLRIARAEVAYHERQLADARRKLAELETPVTPTRMPIKATTGAKGIGLDPTEVREWAEQQPDVTCNKFGPIPDDVLHRYVAAHNVAREEP